MRTVPKIGQRVCFTQGTDVYEGVVVKHDNYHPVKKVLVRWDNPPPGLGKTSWESCSALSRPAKKLSKDKQRIAELEKENAELLQYKSYYDRAKGFLEGRNEVSALETLLEEHAEMKKVLSGETFWVGHDNKKMIESEFGSVPFTSRNDIQPICDYHTKILVLETKAAGEE